jgi:hypothetical protein
MNPVSKAERYLHQAEECIALAKEATSNKMRAHHYATADRYLRLAEAEPTVTNPDARVGKGVAGHLGVLDELRNVDGTSCAPPLDSVAALQCYSAATFFEPPCRSAKRLPSFASCFNSGAGSHQ